MNLDRNNIPDEFLCELCQPRRVDRARARAVQYRKRQEFRLTTPPPAGLGRRERSKDDFVDVEKTPKKFNRTFNPGPKCSRGASKSSTRGDGMKTSKRGGHQKWKRKMERTEENDSRDRLSRKRKVRALRFQQQQEIYSLIPFFPFRFSDLNIWKILMLGDLLLQNVTHKGTKSTRLVNCCYNGSIIMKKR